MNNPCTKMCLKKIAVFFMVVLFLVNSGAPLVCAQDKSYKVKAVFLINFFKYISWPENAGKKHVLCVLGKNPFGSALDYIIENKFSDQGYELRYVRSQGDIKSCHIAFISKSEKGNVDTIIADASSQSGVLLVSELDGFAKKGGGIEFADHSGRVKLKMNKKNVHKAKLKVRSKLMKIVDIVD